MLAALVALAALALLAAGAALGSPVVGAAEPFPPASSTAWTWVPITGAKCMDGRPTGVYIKSAASGRNSGKLAVYFEGGGACFNTFTCFTARDEPHPSPPGLGGEFSSSDPRNPYLDYNWIWVPYCTGDVHTGDAYHVVGEEYRYFAGRNNVRLFMERARATWPKLDVVAVTGESAGGFGAAVNYDFIRGFYGKETRGVCVDDSGPIPDNKALAVCLQREWRLDWNLNKTLPPGCPCIGEEGNMWLGWKFFADRWPGDTIGLISSVNDVVISSFFSFGNLDCESPIPTYYDKLAGGLDRLASNDVYNVSIFMIPGDVHTHTGDKSSFYTKKVGSTLLYKWVGDLVKGINPGTVYPPSK